MRKNLTEIVFILDRSGSMSGLETDTIGGFNSMIEKQKKENGEALISTVLFDNVSEVIHDRVPVQKVEPMTDRDDHAPRRRLTRYERLEAVADSGCDTREEYEGLR